MIGAVNTPPGWKQARTESASKSLPDPWGSCSAGASAFSVVARDMPMAVTPPYGTPSYCTYSRQPGSEELIALASTMIGGSSRGASRWRTRSQVEEPQVSTRTACALAAASLAGNCI